jgi:protein-L-isoaspartate(D-aspartate) O-methyltransferase
VLYVSAGASQPLPVWLDALRLGGRLLFPLTGPDGSGAMLLVTNRGEGRFAARFGMNVAFIPCLGAQDPAAAATVSEALRRPGVATVRSLRRGEPPDRSAWLTGEGWWLSTKE